MKKLLLLLLSSTLLSAYCSDVLFYKTQEDYKLKKAENGGALLNVLYTLSSGSQVYVDAQVSGKKVTYTHDTFAKYWGIELYGVLYRFLYVVPGATTSYDLVEVAVESPKLVVYESIYGRAKASEEKRAFAPGQDPTFVYISKGIDAEIKPIHFTIKSKIRSQTRQALPEYTSVFDCIDAWKKKGIPLNQIQPHIISCFKDFIQTLK